MNVYDIDTYLELKYYSSGEKLFSKENYWDILDIVISNQKNAIKSRKCLPLNSPHGSFNSANNNKNIF